jgi:hypothetical protein
LDYRKKKKNYHHQHCVAHTRIDVIMDFNERDSFDIASETGGCY